ncbi:MAG TPA: hypothetical protein H9825_07400 [Candidatus Sphingobacterium stercorigallinarum]|nr:hypothetical protein [Candidatus Sphingobacterium stercorigallinarum]
MQAHDTEALLDERILNFNGPEDDDDVFNDDDDFGLGDIDDLDEIQDFEEDGDDF